MYIYIYIYIYIPTEPEVIYLGFSDWVIRLIMTKEDWAKRHFMDKVTARKNEKLPYLKEILEKRKEIKI